jgi:hypothetical protein
VYTDLTSSLFQGAATSLFLATNPKVTVSGEYWADSNIGARSKLARDDALAKELYEVSLEITKP